jgi:DNA-binding transcriptional LysR family regulator
MHSTEWDVRLSNLMAFQHVGRLGSFTLAAAALRLTKSSVSKRISDLEADLGVSLFLRTTRKVSFTEVGQLLYDRTEPLIVELTEAFSEIDDTLKEPSGVLKVTAPIELGDFISVNTVAEFTAQYPRLSMVYDLNDRYQNLLTTNADVAIRIGKSPDQSLIMKKVTDIDLYLFASPQYLKKMGSPKKPDDLLKHRLICYDTSPDRTRKITIRNSRETKTLEFKNFLAVSYFRGIRNLIVEDLGIGLIPAFLYTDDIKNKAIVPVLSGWSGDTVSAYAVYPSRKYLSSKVRIFVDYITNELPKLITSKCRSVGFDTNMI